MYDEYYRLVIPERLNMTYMVLDRWAGKVGSEKRPAIYYEDEVISYKELLGLVNRIGNALRRRGVGPGDRVLIYMPNHPLFVALNMAVIKLGGVAVPVSTMFRSREMEYILRTSEAKLAISTPQLIPNIEEARSGAPYLRSVMSVIEMHDEYESIEELARGEDEELETHDTSKDDIAFILYTSGTTGFPKGVPHAHRWLIAIGHPNATLVMGIHGGHRIMSPSEATWVWPYGYCIWYAMYMGAATSIYPGRFDPERTLRYIEKYRTTHFVGNPTIYRRLLAVESAERRFDVSSLLAAFSAGETLSPEIFREWKRRFGCEIYDVWGQTEMQAVCCSRPGFVKPGSMGRPLPGVPLAVIRDDGSLCDVGEVGQLAVDTSFPGLTPGYIKLEDEWRSRIKGRWYLALDYAYVDEDGYFWYVSRTDDLIKSRGYLIGPKEVEDVLHEHEAVLEASVIGVRDAELRERVKAFIILKKGYSPDGELAGKIREFVAARIAPFKAPKEIEFVDSLPKTITGKTMRKVLKRQEESRKEEDRRASPHVFLF